MEYDDMKEVVAAQSKLLAAIDKYVAERHAPGCEVGLAPHQVLAAQLKMRIRAANDAYRAMITANDVYRLTQREAQVALEEFCAMMDARFGTGTPSAV